MTLMQSEPLPLHDPADPEPLPIPPRRCPSCGEILFVVELLQCRRCDQLGHEALTLFG